MPSKPISRAELLASYSDGEIKRLKAEYDRQKVYVANLETRLNDAENDLNTTNDKIDQWCEDMRREIALSGEEKRERELAAIRRLAGEEIKPPRVPGTLCDNCFPALDD
jgi:hypothetical protein